MKHDSVDDTTAASAALHEMFAVEMARYEGPLQTREARALRVANEMVRHWLERELIQLAGRHGDDVVVDGQQYRRHSAGTVTAAEGPTVLMERLAAELAHVRAQRPRLPVVVVQDGAPELWFLVDDCLANLGVTPAMRLLDRYHLDARLAEVSAAVADTPVAAARLLAHWQRCLDRTDSTLGRICRSLDRKIRGTFEDEFTLWPEKPPTLHGSRCAVVKKHLGYFTNGRSRAHYATARRRGFPIGSGVTEGACKSVIASRFKRSGQRWLQAGASTCLLLRTFHLNDRLTAAIDHLVNEQQRSIN